MESDIPVDLDQLAKLWPRLPESVRSAILTLALAAGITDIK